MDQAVANSAAVWQNEARKSTLLIPKNVPHQARTAESPCLCLISYNTGKRVMVPVTAETTR